MGKTIASSCGHDNVLVVGPSWVGDMVMAQSLFKQLKRQRPDRRLTVLAPHWSRPLLRRMPEVDESLGFPLEHGELKLRRRYRLARVVHDHGFDQAIVLPNSFKSALLPLFAGIPRRTGWRGEFRQFLLNDCRRLDPERYPLMVQRFLALALPPDAPLPGQIPPPALARDEQSIRETRSALAIELDRRLLVICPGAEFGEAKQWPASHYAGLASRAVADGWRVIIAGSGKDGPIAGEILQALSGEARQHCTNLAGKTSLEQAIDVISLADGVVSNDSGLMHIAAALERPLVAIYGSTSPDFTPPLSKRVKLLSKELDCRPCFQRRCPLGHLRCLREIGADEAYGALVQVRQPRQGPQPHPTKV